MNKKYKNIAALIAAIMIFSSCAERADNEISQTEEITQTAAFSESVTETKTAQTTAPETAAESETETAPSEAAKREPVLPENTVTIDLTERYKDSGGKADIWDGSIYFPDDDTVCVNYSVYDAGGDGETNLRSELSVFDAKSGEEKAHIVLPSYFDEIRPPDRDGVLLYLTPNFYLWGEADIMPEYAVIYSDMSYEISSGKVFYGNEYGRGCYRYHGDIIDGNSGKTLVKGVYYGDENKGNELNSINFFIDENRFIYSVWGYEWQWRFGMYDYRTDECTVLGGDITEDLSPFGYADGKVYSTFGYLDCQHETERIYVTDLNTLETTLYDDSERGEERELGTITIWDTRLSKGGKYIILENGDERDFTLIDRETGDTVKTLDYENIGFSLLQYAGENIIAVRADDTLYITKIEDNK